MTTRARIAATLAVFGIVSVAGQGVAAPTAYLETDRSCAGALLGSRQRLEVVGWDGDSREAQGQRVYAFRVRCGDGDRDAIDLFLAAERSDRYRRDGDVLMRLQRTERRSVQVKEAGCRQVPRRVQEPPPDSEVRETCRNQRMPMACEIDMLSQRRWVTRMEEECGRAEFETRDVPVWEPFPAGHAPLPKGARIVRAATAAPTSASSQTGAASGPPSSSGGFPYGVILLVGALGAGAAYYFHRRSQEALREQVASARAQMGGGDRADYGASFRSDEFRSSTSHSDRRSHEQTSEAQNNRQDFREPPRQEQPHSADDLPRTIEEACALLNVTPETPHDEISKIYKAMAVVWHVDKAKNETDRLARERKMKQLNAAKDLLLSKK